MRAELVTHPWEYLWSSSHVHAEGKTDPLLIPHAFSQQVGPTAAERQQAYQAWFRHHVSGETLEAIRDATHTAWVLGRERLKKGLGGCPRLD